MRRVRQTKESDDADYMFCLQIDTLFYTKNAG